jgi:transposase
LDAGFGILATLIREKAEWAGRVVVSVDARYTSQTCSVCGHVSKESRRGERFDCVGCGNQADADVNAAQNILMRAVQSAPKSELSPGDARLTRYRRMRAHVTKYLKLACRVPLNLACS